MAYNLSPGYDMVNNLTVQMSTSQHSRHTPRSSGSQSGCRSSRIEKPKSNHNSPRTLERRKTTSGTKRYATLDDHYNMMFGITGEEEAVEEQTQPTRPLSWHPSSAQFHVPSRSSLVVDTTSSQDCSRHYSASSRNSAHGSDFYSLSARSSMYPEQMQNLASYPNSHEAHRGSQDSDSSWQSVPQQTPYPISSYSTPATEPMPWYLQEWARKNQAQATTSRHGSSDFLPIQHPTPKETSADDEEMVDSGKELVGMGLYDLPEPSLFWNTSGPVESTGKGLKLEETWQPPEEEDGDEEDEEEEEEVDDASSDDGSVEELPAKETEHTQLHVPVAIKPQTLGNMDGQSFFFDEDETYTKEWWFQQLKQPSLPVRDAGLGYGWL